MSVIPERIKVILWNLFSEETARAGHLSPNSELCGQFDQWLYERMTTPLEDYETETLNWIGRIVSFCEGCGKFIGENSDGLCGDCLGSFSTP